MHQPENDNPWYPLPADYAELTPAGQREARLAVLHDQSTPERLVIAWEFFRNYYLLSGQPDGFFYKDFRKTPQFHRDIIYDIGAHRLNVIAAPRGSAKSTIVTVELPLLLSLTRPYYNISILMATDSLVEEKTEEIMIQFSDNRRIIEDFGDMKPSSRKGRRWNLHAMRLRNRALIRGLVVGGRKRGARPDLLILDDPEYDPSPSTDTSRLLREFERMLFKVIMPMLRKGSAMVWIGTIINRRTCIYQAIYGDDPRFSYWNRRVYAVEYPPTGPGQPKRLLWPEMWSEEDLARIRREIGPSNFASEYLNQPISESDRILSIDEDLDTYVLPEGLVLDAPRAIKAPVSFIEGSGPVGSSPRKSVPLCELLSSHFVGITVDYAPTLHSYSDYSAVMCWSFDAQNVLWVWDLWLGRARDSEIISQIYRMGMRWKPRMVAVEAVSIQRALADSVADFLDARSPASWKPRVLPLVYPRGHDKASRISALEPRFARHRIKLPLFLRKLWPWSELFHQIEDFTPDLSALEHDDAVDVLAMSQYCIHSRARMAPVSDDDPRQRLLKYIQMGRTTDDYGFPLVINFESADQEIIDRLLDSARSSEYHTASGAAVRGLKNARIVAAPLPIAGGLVRDI